MNFKGSKQIFEGPNMIIELKTNTVISRVIVDSSEISQGLHKVCNARGLYQYKDVFPV